LRLSEIQSETNIQVLHLSAPAARGLTLSADLVGFERSELREIFDIYGRMVAQGIWRDYSMDFLPSRAIFSIFRKNGEVAYYRIVKEPKAARRQGSYSVVAQTGLILKRGAELSRVLAILERKPKLLTLYTTL
jgi:hypothetical protein